MKHDMSKRLWAAVSVLLPLSVAALVLGVAAGSTGFRFEQLPLLFDPYANDTAALILKNIRLPRALLSYLVGGGLAVAGCCLQGVFKNPMADSHILGVSSGAGFGAAVAMSFGISASVLGLGSIAVCAFIGGITCVIIVCAVSRVNARTSIAALLLAGIAASALFSALTSGVMLLNRDKMEKVLLWTMGSFASAEFTRLIFAAATVLPSSLICMFFARQLNIMLLGEEDARLLGVDTARVTRVLLALTTLIAAASVAVAGIIGFVGLMVPHILRLITGPDHRVLLPSSFLGGGVFLCLVDMLSRSVAPPLEIPVGVLSAVCGVPFFFYLLRRRNGGRGRA